jgi:hypothetical protein
LFKRLEIESEEFGVSKSLNSYLEMAVLKVTERQEN